MLRCLEERIGLVRSSLLFSFSCLVLLVAGSLHRDIHWGQVIFKPSAGHGILNVAFPPWAGADAGSDGTWILSSCQQALAEHVCLSARSLSFQLFALVFLNSLPRAALGDVSGFIYTCPFHYDVSMVVGTPSWEQDKKRQHSGMCGVSSIYTYNAGGKGEGTQQSEPWALSGLFLYAL